MTNPPTRLPPPLPPIAALYVTQERPGVVTFVGIVGMIFSILQVLINLAAVLAVAVLLFTTKMSQTMLKMQQVSAQTNVIKNESPDAITDPSELNTAVNGLLQKHIISINRQQQLRQLLQTHGKLILHLSSGLTVERVGLLVSDSGIMMLDDNTNSDFYELGTGRIEIDDRQAIFRPTDGGKALRSSDIINDTSLTEQQIDTFMIQVNQYCQLNSKQQQSLKASLRKADQSIVITPANINSGSQIVTFGTMIENNNTACFFTTSKQVHITKIGELSVLPLGTSVMPTANITKNVDLQIVRGIIVESIASVGLGVLLIVGSAQVLRGRPVGPRLCKIWALIKIPVILLSAGLWTKLSLGITDFGNTDFTAQGIYAIAVMCTIGCMFFPILVLVLLTRKSSTRYFSSVL